MGRVRITEALFWILFSCQIAGADQKDQSGSSALPIDETRISKVSCDKAGVFKFDDFETNIRTDKQWKAVVDQLEAFIQETPCLAAADATKDSSFIFLVQEKVTSGDKPRARYRRVAIYHGPLSYPGSRLSGATVYDVHLARPGTLASADIKTSYSYTPLDNPLIGALSKALATLV